MFFELTNRRQESTFASLPSSNLTVNFITQNTASYKAEVLWRVVVDWCSSEFRCRYLLACDMISSISEGLCKSSGLKESSSHGLYNYDSKVSMIQRCIGVGHIWGWTKIMIGWIKCLLLYVLVHSVSYPLKGIKCVPSFSVAVFPHRWAFIRFLFSPHKVQTFFSDLLIPSWKKFKFQSSETQSFKHYFPFITFSVPDKCSRMLCTVIQLSLTGSAPYLPLPQ